MKVKTGIAASRRPIALEEILPEEALELLRALKQAEPTPAAVALDHLMSGDGAQDGAQPPDGDRLPSYVVRHTEE